MPGRIDIAFRHHPRQQMPPALNAPRQHMPHPPALNAPPPRQQMPPNHHITIKNRHCLATIRQSLRGEGRKWTFQMDGFQTRSTYQTHKPRASQQQG